jgi:hypothetical protein
MIPRHYYSATYIPTLDKLGSSTSLGHNECNVSCGARPTGEAYGNIRMEGVGSVEFLTKTHFLRK